MRQIGFIGIGVMGSGMVHHLLKNGFAVSVYTRTKAKAEGVLAEGAVWCEDIASCVKGKEAVITMVGYPEDVEQVYFGEDGILNHAATGTILIDMTTTSPKLSKRIYDAARKKGLFALDAPVSGGDIGAKNGTLSIMVGGDEAIFETCGELFRAMGTTILYEGGCGSGQHVKMANQIALAGAISGVCEAIAYTKRAGIDVNRMLQTVAGGAAGSWQMEHLGPKIAVGDDAPGFFIKHFIKDMKIALAESEENGFTPEMLKTVLSLYETLAAEGYGELGTQALIRYYEK